MRRLYLHIYLTLIGSLAALTLLFWVTREVFEEAHTPPWVEVTSALISGFLPAADVSADATAAALVSLSQNNALSLSLYSITGSLLATSGEVVELPPVRSTTHWIGADSIALRLQDGRWIVVRTPHHHAFHVFVGLAVLGLLIATASYPFVRRLTRRLERLRSHVDALGSGDLHARVRVEGHDEIADLAKSFNRAATQIEALVRSQRDLLANASHELRSPLTRINLAIEMLADSAGRSDLRDQLQRDIAELDELIGELLLASRLQSVQELAHDEVVDILALARSEGARVDAQIHGEAVEVRGDSKLLRRLLRNLLENAQRYGGGSPIEVHVGHNQRQVVVRVEDRGPGIHESERERVFEPFYRRAGTSESGHGVGLGLALVRQIARRHGGEAHCRARPGGGTCFEVTLPVGEG